MSEGFFKKTLLALACSLLLLGSGCQSEFESGLVVGAGLTGLVVGTIALVSEISPENTPAPPRPLTSSGHNRPSGIRYIFVRDQPVYSSFNGGSVSANNPGQRSDANPGSSSSTGASEGSDSGSRDTSSSSENERRSNPTAAHRSSSSPREVVIEPATTQDALLELPEWLKP